MIDKKWPWVLALSTGSLLMQTSHALAVSLTYNFNFLNSNGTVAGSGSFSTDPDISQTFNLDALPPPFTKTLTVNGVVNQFSANVAGFSWNASGSKWWDPNSSSSTQGLYPNSQINPTSLTVASNWLFLLPANPNVSSGGIAGLNINPFNMSGGVITPNTLWAGNWTLSASSQNQTSGTGTWTASLQGSPSPSVPEPSIEGLEVMGGLVLFMGVLGTKRLKKSRV